ncbi:pyridoxal phosphate-dependent transferase [Phlyctochytrium arcticum]|nr:pyridoxal phosphate-dependent transferase [Phlyctochytrium arcticum]
MGTHAISHVSPDFIKSFRNTLTLLRDVFQAPKGQPFVVAGSGTLAWDMVAANLVEPGEHVLVINTGVFGDWFGECLEVYGAKVTHVRAKFGDRPTEQEIADAFKSQKHFKMVTMTHVDTSTSVIVDIEKVAKQISALSPDTLLVVDGVCSVGGEDIKQQEWGLDVVLTASQKALGTPPGLAVMVVSERALETAANRKAEPRTYFGSFKKWLPIMQKYEAGQPSYFATPAVQLILALETSLKQILAQGLDARFNKHKEASQRIKNAAKDMGLKIVPVSEEAAAHTLTAIYYPEGVKGAELLQKMGANGIVVAGGLHPKHATEYFRIGHMNVSAVDDKKKHIEKTIDALRSSLTELGFLKQ